MRMFRLRNGAEVLIRPIRPDDGERLEAAYDQLSDQTQYKRFLAPKPHLSAAEVRYLVDVDGASHVAVVAQPLDDPERIIGVARFVRLPEDPDTAEFAIVVGDPYQGEGLGSAMLGLLLEEARRLGFHRLRATMLADNQAAHRLMHSVPASQTHRADGTVHEIDVELAA